MTYQNILQLDISVNQTLAVQKPNPFHDVDCHLEPCSVCHSRLNALIQVTLQPIHDQQDSWGASAAITVVNHRAKDGNYTFMLHQ